MRSLAIAATGMLAQQTNVEVISNNLANMGTTGYKRRRAEFQDLIYQNLRRVGSQSSDTGSVLPSGAQVGLGVRTAAIYRISEQGNLQQTENRFDLAIRGNGYFQIQMPSGEVAYTRDGTFALSPEGVMVTAEGFVVQPGITIPANATSVSISAEGAVAITVPGNTQPQTVGNLAMASFINPAGLEPIWQNLFKESAASGQPQQGTPGTNGLGIVKQGSLEAADVNVVEELVTMIQAQRAYEMNSKAIQTSDQMLAKLSQ
eukprot:gene47647-58375_t